jgi:hypothetical protein
MIWAIKDGNRIYIDMTKRFKEDIERYKLVPNYFLNKEIILIKKIYHNCPCGGWGKLLSKEEFLREVEDGTN